MKIKIFEDQTGFQLFPEKSFDKNTTIVKFFDNKIDLFLTNGDLEEDLLLINCYALIQKGQERPIGCYIVCEDKYSDNIFANFKNEANDALKSIGFKPHSDNIGNENVIFDGLEKFDLSVSPKENTDKIIEALNAKERLSYNAGDITEIAVFCRHMLKTIKTIKIAISTVKTNMGDINILRSKTGHERWSPTKETIEIFDKIVINKQRKSEDEKNKKLAEYKKEKGSIGDNKIDEGKKLINDGLTTKRSAGYDIDEDINKIFIEIGGNPSPKKSEGIGTTGLFFISLAMLVLGIVIGTVIIPSMLHKTETSDVVITPVPTAIPTIIETPVPTPVPTTVENNTTVIENNTTDIENRTKALMNNVTTGSSSNGRGNPLTNVTVTVIPNST